MTELDSFDADWKRRALRGEAAAIDHLVSASLPPLYRFCLHRVGGNQHLCEEAVQETLLRAIDELAQYDPQRASGRLLPWLTGLARNAIRKLLSREPAAAELQQFWLQVDEELQQILDRLESAPLAEDALERGETRAMVNATMAQLPSHYREALEAKYLQQQSVRDIALAHSASEKTIESLLTRARRAFRATFRTLTQSARQQPDCP